MGAKHLDTPHEDPPCLRAALAMLRLGLRPVPIYPGKKKPIGEGWGLVKHTEETLRARWRAFPGAGVGLVLGDDGTGNGLIDFEVDDEKRAAAVIDRIFPDGWPDTLSFRASKGPHLFFRYDQRLAKYGQTRIFGEIDPRTGRAKGNPHYLGVEFRIGTIDPAHPVQEQSLVPPTPRDDGEPRIWVDAAGDLLSLPEVALADLSRILPIPECVYADLDRYAAATVEDPDSDPVRPTWDKEEVKAAILPHALDLARRWGLEIIGKRPTSQGFWECRAIDRKDKDPSAGFNEMTGVYTDRKHGGGLSIFQLAVELRAYQDFHNAVNALGQEFHVPSRTGSFEGSDASEGYSQKNKDQKDRVKPWGTPRILDPLPAVPFPLGVLPDSLAQLCREGAVSHQCPVDYFGAVVVALAGAAIGMSIKLKIKADFYVPSHLYLGIVGPSGTKKSPPLHKLAHPFYEIDQELREAYQADKAVYEEQRRDYEAGRRHGNAGPPPVPPVRNQLTLDDTTREALALIHGENPRGIVLIKDELFAWIASMNAYKPGGKGDDRQFWLSINTGSRVKVDRKTGDREPIVIPYPCVTIVGGLTPSMLPGVRGGADDGWLDRILFAYPEPVASVDWTEAVISPELYAEWCGAIRRLWSRPMTRGEDGRLRPYLISMTDAGKALWREWFNRHHREQTDPDFPAALRGPWSKIEGFTGRLILILSQLAHAYGAVGDGLPRDADHIDVWRARLLSDYFKAHFRRTWVEMHCRPDHIPDDALALLKWFRTSHQRSGRTSFSERDAKLTFQTRFGRNPFALADAVSWLDRHECIRPVSLPDKAVGRPHSDVFEVNPVLFEADLLTSSYVTNDLQNQQNLQNSHDETDDWEGNHRSENLGDVDKPAF